jgi:hypothetical protein
MDQEVYTWNPNVHPLFYPLTRSDLSLDRTKVDHVKFTEEQMWQGYANVTISLPRLDLYLRSAFTHASQAMEIQLPRSMTL